MIFLQNIFIGYTKSLHYFLHSNDFLLNFKNIQISKRLEVFEISLQFRNKYFIQIK